MPTQSLLREATDLFVALGGTVESESPVGAVSRTALDDLLREFGVSFDAADLGWDAIGGPQASGSEQLLTYEALVSLLRSLKSSQPVHSPSHVRPSHDQSRHGTSALQHRMKLRVATGVGAFGSGRRQLLPLDLPEDEESWYGATDSMEVESRPLTPPDPDAVEDSAQESLRSILLTPRSDVVCVDRIPTPASPETQASAGLRIPPSAVRSAVSLASTSHDNALGASRRRLPLSRRAGGSKGPFLSRSVLTRLGESAAQGAELGAESRRVSLPGPMVALSAQIHALDFDLPSAADRSPVLARAEAYGGIGATKFNSSVKPDGLAMAEVFPPRRTLAPYSLQEIEEILRNVDRASRPMHKPAHRTPHTSVAFSGKTPIPKLGVMSLEKAAARRKLPKPFSAVGGSGNDRLPRIQPSEPRLNATIDPRPRAVKPTARASGRLPLLQDPYRHRVEATPLEALAGTPSFLSPLRERIQHRQYYSHIQSPHSVEFQQAASPSPGQRFHCETLPIIAANVLSILRARGDDQV